MFCPPEIQLGDTDKPLKLMSTWNKFVSQFLGTASSKDKQPPSFYLRRNVYYPISRESTVSSLQSETFRLLVGCSMIILSWTFCIQVSDSTALEFLYADVSIPLNYSQETFSNLS